MGWDFEVELRALAPRAAVLDIVGQALLPRVEIDGGDALAGFHQGNRDVDGERRFTRAAFFIADHDHVSRLVRILIRLDQHERHSRLALPRQPGEFSTQRNWLVHYK